MAPRFETGFSLVEVLVTLAIVGVLAAIAVPAYRIQTGRAQVAEGLQLAQGVKVAMAAQYVANGAFPANNTAAGVSAATNIRGKYVTSVEVYPTNVQMWAGSIIITYGGQSLPQIQGKKLALHAFISDTKTIVWACGQHYTNMNAINAQVENWLRANLIGGDTLDPWFRPAECGNQLGF